MNNPQASIDQKLKEAEERKKSIETERLVKYLTPAKVDNVGFQDQELVEPVGQD